MLKFIFNVQKLFILNLFILIFFQISFAEEKKKIETQEHFEKIYESIVRITSTVPDEARTAASLGTSRRGTGVVIDDKHILTIGYIVAEADKIEIGLPGGKEVPGDLVAYDHSSGFGILKTILPTKLNPLKLGDSDNISEEDLLFVIPYPDQGQGSGARAVSRRSFAGWWEYYLEKPIYTYPMTQSWAGTPLLNSYGEIIGIGSLYVQESVQGVQSPGNLFVPVNILKPILSDLLKNGRRTKQINPYMGINSEESNGKVYITRVSENGPAARAGILSKDIILSVNGIKVNSIKNFYLTAWSLGGPGTLIKLEVERDQKKISFDIKTVDRMDYFVKPKYL